MFLSGYRCHLFTQLTFSSRFCLENISHEITMTKLLHRTNHQYTMSTNTIILSIFSNGKQRYVNTGTFFFRFDVQTVVERPYLHFIGRSKCSTEDQLVYIPERIIELQQCGTPLSFQGREYKDVIRFNTGRKITAEYIIRFIFTS